MFAVVRGIRSKVAKADTDGEEDLATGSLPNLAATELFTVPLAKVVLDTGTGIGERGGPAENDDDHDNWETHCEVDDPSGRSNALEHAEPNKHPHKCTPANSLADKSSTRVVNVARPGGHDRINIGDDILHVKLLSATAPRQRALERATEVVHDPGEDGNVVCSDDETVHNDSQTNTLGSLIDSIEGDDDTTAVGLADADLET